MVVPLVEWALTSEYICAMGYCQNQGVTPKDDPEVYHHNFDPRRMEWLLSFRSPTICPRNRAFDDSTDNRGLHEVTPLSVCRPVMRHTMSGTDRGQ